MIYIFRKEMKKWQSVLWVVLAAFIVSSLSMVIFRRTDPGSEKMASVNGYEISFRNYNKALAEVRMQIETYKNYAKAYGISVDLFLNFSGLNNPEKAAFDKCVRDELLDRGADDFKIKFSSDYFSEKLALMLPPQLKDQSGQINMEAYKFYLSKLMTSVNEYEDNMEEEFKRELIGDFIKKSLYVPIDSTKEIFSQDNVKKSFYILQFPFNVFLDEVKKTVPTKEELKKFFTDNKEKYRIPEKRKVKYWVISPKEYVKNLEIDDSSIQGFYERNKSSLFRVPPKIKVKHILIKVDEKDSPEKIEKLISKAKDIQKLVQQDSMKFDEFIKKNAGGEIDFFAKGTHDPDFEKAAFRLKDKNEISDVVKTEKGYEIIQLVDRIAAKEKPLAIVRDEIVETIKAKKALNMLKGDLESVLYKSKSNQNAIDDYVRKNELKTEETNWLIQKNSAGVDLQNVLAEKIFAEKKREGVRGVFSYKDNQVLYVLSGIQDSTVPEFSVIEKDVLDDFFKDQAKRNIKSAIRKTKNEILNKKITIQEAAKRLNLKGEKTELITKEDTVKTPKTIVSKAFVLNDSAEVLSCKDGLDNYLVQMLSSDNIDSQEFAKQERTIVENEKNKLSNGYMGAFIASLLRNARIETSKKL